MNAGRAGETIGAWTLVEPLGAGTFAATWRARDALGRAGALKLLDAPPGDAVCALERLCHPALPALFDAGAHPRPFLVMEVASGRSLRRMLRSGRAPEEAALRVAVVLADALSSMHHAGICHGDVKPANVVIGRIADGQISLEEFTGGVRAPAPCVIF